MNQTVFLVKWFGPFSQEEINEWEKSMGRVSYICLAE